MRVSPRQNTGRTGSFGAGCPSHGHKLGRRRRIRHPAAASSRGGVAVIQSVDGGDWHEGTAMTRSVAWMSRALAAATLCAALASLCAPAAARDFRAADTQAEDYPTVQALAFMDKAGQRAQRRPAPCPHLPLAPARRGEGDDRADAGRRHRPQPHQCRRRSAASFPKPTSSHCHSCSARSSTCTRCWTARSATTSSASFEPHGFIGLAFYDSGARSIYNAVRPIRTLAD